MCYMQTMLIVIALAVAAPAAAQARMPAEPAAPDAVRARMARERAAVAGAAREALQRQRGRGGPVQTETTTHTARLGASPDIDVAHIAGDIVITRGGGNETTVEVTKTARAGSDQDARKLLELARVDIIERGQRLQIRTRVPDGDQGRRSGRGNLLVRIAVSTPAATRVKAHSLSGSVTVENIDGEVVAESLSGHVKIVNAGRVVAAKSMSGGVEIANASSDRPLQVSSVSGSVVLRRVKADHIDAGSVSGEIVLEDVISQRLKAQTVSGPVQFSGAVPAGARLQLGSHSGSLRVAIGGGAGFEVEATSFSGEVKSDFPITLQPGIQQAGRHGPHALRGVHGGGGAFLQLTTFSGGIAILKR